MCILTLNRNICYLDKLDSQSCSFQRREKAKGKMQFVFKEQQELSIIYSLQHFPFNRTFLWMLQAEFLKLVLGFIFCFLGNSFGGKFSGKSGTLRKRGGLERHLFPRNQGPFYPATRACAFHLSLTGEAGCCQRETSASRDQLLPLGMELALALQATC